MLLKGNKHSFTHSNSLWRLLTHIAEANFRAILASRCLVLTVLLQRSSTLNWLFTTIGQGIKESRRLNMISLSIQLTWASYIFGDFKFLRLVLICEFVYRSAIQVVPTKTGSPQIVFKEIFTSRLNSWKKEKKSVKNCGNWPKHFQFVFFMLLHLFVKIGHLSPNYFSSRYPPHVSSFCFLKVTFRKFQNPGWKRDSFKYSNSPKHKQFFFKKWLHF